MRTLSGRVHGLLRRAVLLCCCTGLPLWAQLPVYGYRVVARLPHDPGSYTEGFFFRDGHFYEGTGLEAHSAVLVTEPASGKVIRSTTIAPQLFGEGIVDWGPYLYEWTWTSHTGFVYERDTLKPVRQFQYDGEGWGMTHDAQHIITSNGSADLTFRDPATFQPVRAITVHDGPMLFSQLNELEWVKGEIYANVWHTDRILRIAPSDGHVIAMIDLTGLLPEAQRPNFEAVLNGIAYDAARDRLFVTGKQWPTIFQIELVSPK